QSSSIDWNGRVAGAVLAPGVHRLQLAAQDRAGNVSEPGKPFDVVLRYVAIARDTIHAKTGTKFGVRVSADARVHWQLLARVGGRLRLSCRLPGARWAHEGLRGGGGRRRDRRRRDRRGLPALAVAGRGRDARLRAGPDPGPRRRDRREPAAAALRGRRRRGGA